jgi:hypothetical protein
MKSIANNTVEKTQSELKSKREVQRDNYNLAIAFLPLLGVVVWLGLVLINALIIDQSKVSWQNSINSQEALIETEYGQTLLTHGELVTKTNQLAGVIDKDIQPEEVFLLVENLFPEDPEFNVVGFGRDNDGSFNVTVAAPSYLKFSKIARRFSLYEKVQDVRVMNAVLDRSNQIIGTINFSFVKADFTSATE